ncbi:MAG: hypothetical protein ABSB74_20190, partial [Tepidisphaeraceae bacterium]
MNFKKIEPRRREEREDSHEETPELNPTAFLRVCLRNANRAFLVFPRRFYHAAASLATLAAR